MSDENDIAEAVTTSDGAEGPVCGERLAEARRKLQISVFEIAKELHLDDFKVRALESNEFDVIGAPVFAKGHLRKYAQLVKVDEADVLADYYQLERASGAPLVLLRSSRPRQMISLGPWIATVVVIAIASSGYWWFTTREAAPARPVTGEIAPLPQQADPVAEIETGLLDQPLEDETRVDVDPEPQLEPVSQLPVETDVLELSLSITYSGDCWTEVTDASGRRLFFDLGKSGRTVNLSGEAPFNVLFGNADNVSIVVNGAAFEIRESDRRGQTARLTLTGS